MSEYLKPGEAGSFLGYAVRAQKATDYVLCPVCSGHGGWNLRLHAYGEGRHFQAHCDQCSGWGWCHPDNAGCVHEWKHTRNLGRCYNEYECVKCGKTRTIDSGD